MAPRRSRRIAAATRRVARMAASQRVAGRQRSRNPPRVRNTAAVAQQVAEPLAPGVYQQRLMKSWYELDPEEVQQQLIAFASVRASLQPPAPMPLNVQMLMVRVRTRAAKAKRKATWLAHITVWLKQIESVRQAFIDALAAPLWTSMGL